MKYSVYCGLLIVSLLLLSSIAFAEESFSARYVSVKDRIFSDEVAEFVLTVRNFDLEPDEFTVFSTDPSWIVYYDQSVITVGPQRTTGQTLILDPVSTVISGAQYQVPLTIKSLLDDEVQVLNIPVIVNSDEIREYQPAVFVDVTVGENQQVDPKEPLDIKIRLINKNPLNIDPLEVEFFTPFVNDSFSLRLAPEERITKILTYDIDKQTPPQDFSVDVYLTANGRDLGLVRQTQASIITSDPGFARDVQVDFASSLKTQYEVEFENAGNIQGTETISLDATFWQRWFTKATPGGEYIKDDGTYKFVYEVTLEPGEKKIIAVTTNYIPFVTTIVIIIVLVIAAIIAYYMLRSPVVVTKRVEMIQSNEKGVVSKLKVILDVKNRTGKQLEHVKVLERVPNITEVEREFAIGTLKPTKIITSQTKGTLIRWNFATLEPYEERLITYNVKSKLSILGNISLPATIVRFDEGSLTRTVKEDKIINDDE